MKKKLLLVLMVTCMLVGCGSQAKSDTEITKKADTEKATEGVNHKSVKGIKTTEEDKTTKSNKLQDAKEFKNYLLNYMPQKFGTNEQYSEDYSKYDDNACFILNMTLQTNQDQGYQVLWQDSIQLIDNELYYQIFLLYNSVGFLDYLYTMDVSIASDDGDYLQFQITDTQQNDDNQIYGSYGTYSFNQYNENELNHLYDILGKSGTSFRILAGVNSNGNIECQLDDDTCNKIRSIIDSYRELQAMRK